jgi:carbamoylphosphate synthase large subunit
VLQPFLAGGEFSVITVWHAGRCNVYPPVSKGVTSMEGVHPSRRARMCPAPLQDEPAWRALVQACVDYLRPFRPCGPVEFEFIRSEGAFFLLEVNPRLAATARLAAVASRHEPLRDLIRALLGLDVLGRVVASRGCATEFLTPHDVTPAARAELGLMPGTWVSTRITLAAPDRAALTAREAAVRTLLGSGA